ncbi:hypothetical protein O181_021117 [Austropuccinia psidii MF-1]|uniref:Uncharacterized protein n=1 Tax=Austropuccinia psidii MF-1 TaxID=1389203 RepID=A0A9Q3CCZ5_9BASI|nr:hypothetical protein [Austropuccinia psidii MF-1]
MTAKYHKSMVEPRYHQNVELSQTTSKGIKGKRKLTPFQLYKSHNHRTKNNKVIPAQSCVPGALLSEEGLALSKLRLSYGGLRCHNHGNSPPWIPIWHIKPRFLYGQLAISITSGQYGHVIILWTIYGHLCFGAFMALHLNPAPIAAIYAQMGISGHFPQNQGKWPKWLFLAIWAHNAHLRTFAHFAHFCAL